ncbi:hypothetical protein [Streptomyces lutosisoli]|uniref:Uncharacterized protein n=1 Tax=Streptomyces lutosisoli TaxID=2665721 RepID=A0ABW2VW54_9ACTN
MNTNADRTAAADALGWAMLAELTGCADVVWALGGPAPGDTGDGSDSAPHDGADR